MDSILERLSKLQIPEEQKERNEVLLEALQTQKTLLIEFALAIGAEPRKGGEKMLEYAIKQGNLALVKEMVPYINNGKATAMCMAINNNQIEIGTWLSEEGASLLIDQWEMRKHHQTITHILSNNPEARTEIKYGALLHAAVSMDDEPETLTMLLDSMKKNTPEVLDEWIVKLAEDTVDTDRVKCMEVMVKFGLDVRYVNTKYCQNENMRKFLKDNGARID